MTDPNASPGGYEGRYARPDQQATGPDGAPASSAPNPWAQPGSQPTPNPWSAVPDGGGSQSWQTPGSAPEPAQGWQAPGSASESGQGWQAPGSTEPTATPGWQQPGGSATPGWQQSGGSAQSGWQQPPPAQGWQQPPPPPGQGWQQPPGQGWQQPGQQPTWGTQGAGGQSQGRAWTNFRPGIVPIRPLQLSDILDGAIKLVRFNPKATLGLSIIVNLLVGVVSVLMVYLVGDPNNFIDATDPDVGVIFGPTINLLGAQIPAIIAAALLPAVLIAVAMQAVLGRKIGIGDAWRAARGRLIAYLAAQLIIGLAAGAVFVILFLLAIASIRDQEWGGLLAVLLLGFPLIIVGMLWLSTKMMFAGPSIIIERLGPVAGLARSWRLTQGAFWRILGISLLTSMILSVIAGVVSYPLTFIVMAIYPNAVLSGGVPLLLASVIGQVIASAITTPFQSGVACLLYVDQRIRKEGFDIDLINEVGRQSA